MEGFLEVSTHASVRRRLADEDAIHHQTGVSTHASVRRRLCELIAQGVREQPVSTHASVRRRPHVYFVLKGERRFNSRLREEATRGRARGATWSNGFNSRLREEATVDGLSRFQDRAFQLTPP